MPVIPLKGFLLPAELAKISNQHILRPALSIKVNDNRIAVELIEELLPCFIKA